MARYKQKPKMEFSKRLAVLNTVIYVLVLLFCLGVWFRIGAYPKDVFTAVTAQYATTLSVYMLKAGVENYQKINNNTEVCKDE